MYCSHGYKKCLTSIRKFTILNNNLVGEPELGPKLPVFQSSTFFFLVDILNVLKNKQKLLHFYINVIYRLLVLEEIK